MEASENTTKHESSANGHRYSFDGFELDPANRILQRGGEAIPLPAKVFDVLLVFAGNPGRLLEKNELIEKVWREDFVEEGNLARHVSTLRKALGDNGKDRKYIVTVQGRGYRFIADVEDVSKVKPDDHPQVATQTAPIPDTTEIPPWTGSTRITRRWRWAIPVAVVLLTVVWIGKTRLFTRASQIKSLAVLPLKSLDASENQLGAGIADGVIRRISQTGQLTVRPTSAVFHYINEDKDALAAARELNTDAVLEGSIQRADDRVRVSVNLLRTGDGKSLWADSFDIRGTDVFLVQDKLAQQIVTRLRIQLDPAQQAQLSKRHTSSAIAYGYYVKGIYNLDLRGHGMDAKPQMEDTIHFFERAIESDSSYSLAHAQLAYAYVWTALFVEPTEPRWAVLAREEIKRSQALDQQLAESHVANALLLWSAYEGFQNEAAVRELLIAQQLNPSVGHADLANICEHIGLENLASRELQRALDVDPTSQSNNDLTSMLLHLGGKYDEWLTAKRKVKPEGSFSGWYLLGKGRLNDAERAIDAGLAKAPDDPDLLGEKALLLALRGNFRAAEAKVPGILAKLAAPSDPSYHHSTYSIACIYALVRRSGEAVKWLKETAATGFPNYPLFERDSYLDGIRQTPEFVQFMAQQRARWEQLCQEFGD